MNVYIKYVFVGEDDLLMILMNMNVADALNVMEQGLCGRLM